MSCFAIIKIAGKGTRMTGDVPKQFRVVGGKPVFIHTLEAFQSASLINYICVVTDNEHMDFVKHECDAFCITKAMFFALGGETGNDSTFNGYKVFLKQFTENDIVVSHDGVRPLVTPEMIDEVVNAILKGNDIATPAMIPNGMMLYRSNHKKFIKREDILELQTPTAISASAFNKMYDFYYNMEINERLVFSGIDSIAFALGYSIYPTKGNALNFKITYDEDLVIFETIINIKNDVAY